MMNVDYEEVHYHNASQTNSELYEVASPSPGPIEVLYRGEKVGITGHESKYGFFTFKTRDLGLAAKVKDNQVVAEYQFGTGNPNQFFAIHFKDRGIQPEDQGADADRQT